MHIEDSIHQHQLPSAILHSQRPTRLHLNILKDTDTLRCDKQQYIAYKKMHHLHIMEIKGTFEHAWHFNLPTDSPCFWLIFQFMGASHPHDQHILQLKHAQYQGFYTDNEPLRVRVEDGKIWIVMLGVQLSDNKTFQEEWPLLRSSFTPTVSFNIGYRIHKVFEKIGLYKDSPYSTEAKLHYYYCQLVDLYHKDLEDSIKNEQTEDIALYHQAVLYIRDHYMDSDIDRNTIAEHLNVSIRKLYRAFEHKNTSINTAIQTIRLYKAREMLRETKISVDGIAFQLHFSSAKYFYRQFVQLFGHSPSRERELYDLKNSEVEIE